MKNKDLGRSGISASVIGFGAWAIGGGKWWGKTDDKNSIKTVQAAIDCGINLIDTAPVYGLGRSERIIGQSIKGRRDKVIISTKCGLIWWGDKGSFLFEDGGNKILRNLEPDSIRREVENSLKNLATDYIDILFTHHQAAEPYKTPIEITMEALLKLKEEGKIRAVGVSNCSVPQMKEYMAVGRIEVNQSKYSMLDRELENTILSYCIQNDISIMAYSPLEQGLLTGKITMEYQPPAGTFRNEIPWYKPENRIRVIKMLDGWVPLAKKYDATISQLVIAWTLNQRGISHVLCGARHAEQVLENAKAGNIKIEENDLAQIRKDIEDLGSPA